MVDTEIWTMWTVSKLAARCGLSRGTLLYYESIGLLKPPARSAGNYRSYGERDLQRLQQICAYRHAGLTLDDIRAVFIQMDRGESDAAAVLKRRLVALDGRDRNTARSPARHSEAAQKRFDWEKEDDHKREVGFHHESLGADQGGYAPLACGVREGGAGGASGVSGIPAHPGGGDSHHTGLERARRRSRLKGGLTD
jgi:DNA-binding transcriptional MerR regulator